MEAHQDPNAADAAELTTQLAEARAEAAVLREELEHTSAARQDANAAADALHEQLDAAAGRMREAASRYRELALRSEPALPADLISGEDVEGVAASVEAAREMVGRVRSHIESQASASRVPVGAPERRGIDLGALSAEQKIRYGLAQRG
jgi:hypothetical protein